MKMVPLKKDGLNLIARAIGKVIKDNGGRKTGNIILII